MGRDRWGDIYASANVKRMVALYDYDPQELSPNVDSEVNHAVNHCITPCFHSKNSFQVELSFLTGEIIYVYGEPDDDGFYMGELNGVRGLVPSNFLTEPPPDYDRRRAGPHHLGPGNSGPLPSETSRRGPPGVGVRGPPPPPRETIPRGSVTQAPPRPPEQDPRRKGPVQGKTFHMSSLAL